MSTASRGKPIEALTAWVQIPVDIQSAIEGLTGDDLDLRGGPEGWSIRETIHHLVEANLVAGSIIIAALGQSGCTYDWSWLNPDLAWMERMGYKTAPVEPAIEALRALTRHLSGVIDAAPDARQREVKLLDAPGAQPRSVSIEEILVEEVKHVSGHLREVTATLAQRSLRWHHNCIRSASVCLPTIQRCDCTNAWVLSR